MLWALGLLWVAVTGIYLMFHVGLGPPPPGQGPQANPDFARRVDAYFDESYWDFLARLIGELSLGDSFFGGGPVRDWVLQATPPTLSLLFFAFLFASLYAVPLGIFWGRRRPGRLTRPLKALSAVLFGVSFYSIALLLIYWVGWKWGLLPLGGYCDLVEPATDCGGFADWAKALVLPGIALGTFFAAVYVRLVSGVVRDAERARTNGGEGARRRALLSYAKLLGRDFGFGLGLVVLVESIFGIPGLGRSFIAGLEGFDAPTMEGTLIFASLLGVGVNLAVDVAVAAAEPSFRRF
jgi:peptide/nickel transport system permease protein